MSDGKTHTQASILLASGFTLGSLLMGDVLSFYYVLGALIGVFISPDTDVDAGFTADRYIRKRLGWWAEKGWDVLWRQYRRSIKHGSEFSHWPVLSTLGRIGYLYVWLIVVPHFIVYFLIHPTWNLWYVLDWYAWQIAFNYRIILGMIAADTIHYILDQVDTYIGNEHE